MVAASHPASTRRRLNLSHIRLRSEKARCEAEEKPPLVHWFSPPPNALSVFGDRRRRIANSKEGAVDDGRMRQLPHFSRINRQAASAKKRLMSGDVSASSVSEATTRQRESAKRIPSSSSAFHSPGLRIVFLHCVSSRYRLRYSFAE